MKQRRLLLLLGVMILMIAARLWVGLSPSASPVVDAIARRAPPRDVSGSTEVTATSRRPMTVVASGADVDRAPPGNLFTVRRPAQAIMVVPQPAPPADPPPPDPPPALQVIGTYDDAKAPGVFVGTPDGVEVARVGTLLGTDYRVLAMTHQSITVQRIATKREYVLAMPAGGPPP